MLLLTWNLNHRAARRRIPAWIVTAIAAQNPDVVVLTEYVEGVDHESFVSSLASLGLSSCVWSSAAKGQNQILIASRQELCRGDLMAPPLHESVPSNALHVVLKDTRVNILGFRMPAFEGKARPLKREVWNWLQNAGATLRQLPSVITGDFNTAPGDSRTYCGDCLEQMSSDGWQHVLPGSGFSWKSARYGTERVIDHTFLSPTFPAAQAAYLWDFHSLAENAASGIVGFPDHAILITSIGLPPFS